MSRALRILFRGAYYHVMNRGIGRSYLFLDKKDYQTFLQTTKEACSFLNVQIIAYCLMNTHYHLLVHTPEGNLPRFMRHINGVFTQRRNQRHKTDGPIFKGRYLANIVHDGEYLLKCVRYINLNPFEANIVPKGKTYEWSSHKDYLKGEDDGRWLNVVTVLKRFDLNIKQATHKYVEFLKAGNDELTQQFYQKKRKAVIFGPDEYIDELKQIYLHSNRIYDIREIPEAKKIKNEQVFKLILKTVCKEFKIKEEYLYESAKRVGNLPRQIAINLTKELTQLPNNEIAKIFRVGTYKTVSAHLYRFRTKLKKDNKLENLYRVLLSKCSQVET